MIRFVSSLVLTAVVSCGGARCPAPAESDGDHRLAKVLARAAGTPAFIAAGGGWVYWSETIEGDLDSVMGVSLEDGEVRPFGAPFCTNPAGLAAHPDGGVVWTCSGAGGRSGPDNHDGVVAMYLLRDAATIVIAEEQYGPWAVAVDRSGVYWVNAGGPRKADGAIMRWDGAAAPRAIAVGLDNPTAIAIDESTVYVLAGSPSEVVAVSKAGGGLRTIAVGEEETSDLAVDDVHVYWTTTEGVFRARKQGGAPEQVARLDDIPIALAIDGEAVFVATYEGSIVRVSKADGKRTLLAARQPEPTDLALDTTHVYWGNVGYNAIVMTEK